MKQISYQCDLCEKPVRINNALSFSLVTKSDATLHKEESLADGVVHVCLSCAGDISLAFVENDDGNDFEEALNAQR